MSMILYLQRLHFSKADFGSEYAVVERVSGWWCVTFLILNALLVCVPKKKIIFSECDRILFIKSVWFSLSVCVFLFFENFLLLSEFADLSHCSFRKSAATSGVFPGPIQHAYPEATPEKI